MAGPYTGTWRNTHAVPYVGATNWGTGINPVHAIRDGYPLRHERTKLNYETPDLGAGDSTDPMVDDVYWPELESDVDPRETSHSPANDLRDHPNLDEVRGNNPVWPSWGGSRKTRPAGNFIRSLLHGAFQQYHVNQIPNETVSEGWLNKPKGEPADALPSDDKQLIIQTSMVQRNKVRAGSQRTGSQSDFDAPIGSRIVGQKVKQYSDSHDRQWDMFPFQQDDIIRPFLSREAGVGYREWHAPNEYWSSDPIQRSPAPDPYQGQVSPSESDVMTGYTEEDYSYV